MTRSVHGLRLGRPPFNGVPSHILRLRLWGASVRVVRSVQASVVQLEFPLEFLPKRVPNLYPMFPDPLRQYCFQVRHD